MRDELIKLISSEISDETDATGEAVTIETSKTVFAKICGVKRNEYYQAQAVGLKPEITFLLYEFEYSGEKIVEFNNKRYNVIRSYPVKSERIELVCNDIAEVG